MNDDEQSKVLPTRHSDSRPDGGAMGSATERQMRASVSDTNSFNTRFVTNADGSTTRLRTRGGMCEYVTEHQIMRASESRCSIEIDNGVVDLVSASFIGNAPNDDISGVLMRTEYVQQVVSSDPIERDTGPVIGKISPPNSSGVAPADYTEAESFVNSESLGSPYGKKRLATIVPPSVFTGKMRQYIQALYGRHDHADFINLPPDSGIGATPHILMDWTKRFDGNEIRLDTNCGIYTDAETGAHFLIVIRYTSIKIFKLKPSPCAKKLRDAMLNYDTPAGDKMRIESYILSQSKPDIASMVERTAAISGYSMGYGWHFNYDGTCCDMVENTTDTAGNNVSFHHRLTIAKGSSDEDWTVSYALIEGPMVWKNQWTYHPITSPAWGIGGLTKMGVRNLSSPSGSGMFYVFYTRKPFSESATGSLSVTMQSDLQDCRYSAEAGTTTKGAIRFPEYMNPTPGLGYAVFGSDSSYYEAWADYPKTTITLNCGNHSAISCEDSSKTSLCNTHSSATADDVAAWANFGPGGEYAYSLDSGQGVPSNCQRGWYTDPYEGSIYVNTTTYHQPNLGPYDQETGIVAKVAYLASSTTVKSTWTDENFTAIENKESRVIVVIPYNDAESVYLQCIQDEARSEDGISSYKEGAFYYKAYGIRSGDYDPFTVLCYYATCGNQAEIAAVQIDSTIDRTFVPRNSFVKVIGGYGEANMASEVPSANAFFNSVEFIVPVVVKHVGSASGNAGYSYDLSVSEGLGSAVIDDRPFSFVGWA